MTVPLRVVSTSPRDGDPSERMVEVDARLSIGRGEDNGLVLPDPERLLSKSHCVIERRSAQYVVIDHSTNGTFLNDACDRLPREAGGAAPGERRQDRTHHHRRTAAAPCGPHTHQTGIPDRVHDDQPAGEQSPQIRQLPRTKHCVLCC
jgi:hypothetical protein